MKFYRIHFLSLVFRSEATREEVQESVYEDYAGGWLRFVAAMQSK